MSVPVAYLSEAEDDIDGTYRWYEARQPGLGQDFINRLQERVVGIATHPTSFALFNRRIRTAPVQRFPYFIYYVVESPGVLIVAVVHGRRSRRAWRGRRF